jgi:reverse gyrase
MGFFDEFTSFMGDVNSIKSEMTNFRNDFVNELQTEAKNVSQTIDGTANNLRQTAVEITETVKQTTTLTPEPPQTTDDSNSAD